LLVMPILGLRVRSAGLGGKRAREARGLCGGDSDGRARTKGAPGAPLVGGRG